MEFGSPQTRIAKNVRLHEDNSSVAASTHRSAGACPNSEAEATIQREPNSRRMDALQAHPVAELLACPPAIGLLLNDAAQCLTFEAGQVVFRQSESCRGLYLVVSGLFQRRAERLETRLILALARAGDLVELAAALGEGHHTCTLAAQTAGSLLMLPTEALAQAFGSYPPLRMQLLEELARAVSRAYNSCSLGRALRPKRDNSAA